jgi:integrase/recombinase XerD
LEASSESLFAKVVFAYCAELRVGEIVGLTLADVNLQHGTIEIRDTKFFKDRRLTLAAGMIAALKNYLVWNQKFGL